MTLLNNHIFTTLLFRGLTVMLVSLVLTTVDGAGGAVASVLFGKELPKVIDELNEALAA